MFAKRAVSSLGVSRLLNLKPALRAFSSNAGVDFSKLSEKFADMDLDAELTPEQQDEIMRELFSRQGEAPDMADFSDLDKDILNDPQFDLKNAEVAARDDIIKPANAEVLSGEKTSHRFETETRQILDIVINSLYTDKDVFLRELVSNGSDALEKAAFLKSADQLIDPEVPFEVRIFTDDVNNTITIQDTGIGMTSEELVTNLGTIAKSGSKQWVKDMANKGGANTNIIGQFGVGFYAGYMVGHNMEVYSQSARKPTDGSEKYPANYWTSEGTGAYEMSPAEGVERGTKIIIHLRDECKSFSMRSSIEGIIKKYSNFVGYPIYLNGVRLNTIQAIWNMSKNEVTEEQHTEFYRYYTGAYDAPAYRMHFNTDAPLQINALFYFPERHMEKFGMGRMETGTSLYCKKVLIKSKAAGLLPEYFRFVQGVVDSEDIPLNISRENMQDSLLITRMSSVLTKRVIRFFQDEAKKNPEKYLQWYAEFNAFLKEGVCSDFTHKNELARLLRFDSSQSETGESVSLDEYVSRMAPSQQNIYYLCAPNRATALSSPYYEGLKEAGFEVLFLYHTLDDFVMQNLRDYNKRKIVSAESGNTEVNQDEDVDSKAEREAENADLISYLKETLGARVSTISISTRLTSHPAVVVDHESAAIRKMMKMMDNSGFGDLPIAKQKLEVNPTHPIFVKMMQAKETKPAVAAAVAEQIFDNALLAADILDNPRSILTRMNTILESALDK